MYLNSDNYLINLQDLEKLMFDFSKSKILVNIMLTKHLFPTIYHILIKFLVIEKCEISACLYSK